MTPGRVPILSGERSLVGYLFEHPRSVTSAARPGVLFVHGSGSDQRGYASRAEAVVAATGGAALTFDLSGHGESAAGTTPRRFAVADHVSDVTAAYDVLADVEGVDRIGVCGASYGAYIAVLLTPRRPVSRLLLRAPARGDDTERRASVEAYEGPVMVVESGADEVIGKDTIPTYLRELRGRARLEVIEGATHALSDPAWQRRFQDLIVEWFRDL